MAAFARMCEANYAQAFERTRIWVFFSNAAGGEGNDKNTSV